MRRRRSAAAPFSRAVLGGVFRGWHLFSTRERLRLFASTKPGSHIPVTPAQIGSMAGAKVRITSGVIGNARRDGLVETGWHSLAVLDLPEMRRRSKQGA